MLNVSTTMYQYIRVSHYDMVIQNVLTYIIMLCVIFLMVRLEYIYKSFLSHNKFNQNFAMFNKQSVQIQKDIKSKSLDTVDTNIVLQYRTEQLIHEIDLLKYKQRCCQNEIDKFKDLYSKI